jgi:hypothetical protein
MPEEYAINWCGINKEYIIKWFYVIPVSVLRMLLVATGWIKCLILFKILQYSVTIILNEFVYWCRTQVLISSHYLVTRKCFLLVHVSTMHIQSVIDKKPAMYTRTVELQLPCTGCDLQHHLHGNQIQHTARMYTVHKYKCNLTKQHT